MGIIVRDVRFRYGRKAVLHGVDWSIGPGVTGLVGPNGAGKSTLLSLLVGLTAPESGSLHVAGNDMSTRVGRNAARRSVGFVPQRFSLVPAMRVRDTVAYAAWVNGVPDAQCMGAASEALRCTGLSELASERVRTLSGGQRQRVGIAAAVAHRPSLLVLDEPTVGLDPAQRLQIRAMLRELGATRSVLMSTHLIEDVAHTCDSVGVMVNGRIAFSGDFDALAARAGASLGSGIGSQFEYGYAELIRQLEQN